MSEVTETYEAMWRCLTTMDVCSVCAGILPQEWKVDLCVQCLQQDGAGEAWECGVQDGRYA